MCTLFRSLLLWLVFPCLLYGCTRSTAAVRTIALAPCRLKGVNHEVMCGSLEVFENRTAKTGRRIALRIAVIPALAGTPAPDPLFVLAGGPGQAATQIAEATMPLMEKIIQQRDVVYVDQRGTGDSHPLDCDPKGEKSLADMLADDDSTQPLRACLASYDADPRFYTTSIAMDDLEDVRVGLGYSRINLFGASYGTRAGLVYMRQHPAQVRSATLDGVAPTTLVLPLSFARDGQRALDLLFANCASDATCDARFPNLSKRFADLLARLDRAPAKTRVSHPVTGAFEEVSISRRTFVTNLRGLLYVPEAAALIPLTIDRAAAGDFGPFVAQSIGITGGIVKGISLGMFYSVVCAEDATFVRPESIGPLTQDTFLGRGFTDDIMRVCSFWPRGTVPTGYGDAVSSEVPTLLLSGELDPVTPPAHAEEVARTLPNSLHVVVPGVGHGAAQTGCTANAVANFVASGTVKGLDVSCVKSLKRPPFFVSFAGPTP